MFRRCGWSVVLRSSVGRQVMEDVVRDGDAARRQQRGDEDDIYAKETKRRKTMDDVLKQVLDEALAARDRGEHTDMDYVYKKTQDRMYEAEYGRPPPSRGSQYLNHIPPEPKEHVRRLVPLTLFDDDPWPSNQTTSDDAADPGADSCTSQGTANDDDEIQASTLRKTDGASIRGTLEDFTDAADELFFWECRYLDFLRSHPLGLRRSLPLLVEHYKLLTHRIIRAEKRFIAARDKAIGEGHKLDPAKFAVTEERIENIRMMYSETYRSLSQASYDPTNMNKSFTGKILTMTQEEYDEWKSNDRAVWNSAMAAFEE